MKLYRCWVWSTIRRGSVVSRVVRNREKGNVTIFAFDEGQGLSEHTSPFDAFVAGS